MGHGIIIASAHTDTYKNNSRRQDQLVCSILLTTRGIVFCASSNGSIRSRIAQSAGRTISELFREALRIATEADVERPSDEFWQERL